MTTALQEPMRLQLPTDRLILEQLQDGRNLAANIALEIDRSRNYINGRMGQLLDYDLVVKIGPLEDSGLYQITPRGVAVVRLADQYETSDDFEQLVDERASQIEVGPPAIVDHAEEGDS